MRISLRSVRLGGTCRFPSLTAVLAIWILMSTGAAQPRPDVTLWIPGDSVPADEPFALMIESSTPAHRGIAFPPATADSAFGPLEVLGRSDVYTRRVGSGYAIDSVSYTVQTSARDSVRIPAVPIRVDAAAGTLTTHTVPRTVWVADGRDRSSASMRAEEPVGFPDWEWLLIGLVAVISGGSVYLWLRSQEGDALQEEPAPSKSFKRGKAPSAPHEAATRRLDALPSSDLSTPDAVETFYVTLADILRTYLAHRWNLAPEKHTTQELMALLNRQTGVPPSAIEQLRRVLEQSDRVKFAGARPDPSVAKEALQAAQRALDLLEEAPSPTPSPGATGSSD